MIREKRVKSEYDQKLLEASRVARVVKGGKRFSFRALVIIGNRKGKVALGIAKGADLTDATQKAVTKAKRALITIPITGGSIPHEVRQKYGASKILLKPAPKGSGIIAGGPMRVILELGGVQSASGKIIGSANKLNCAMATILALGKFKTRKIEDKDRKESSKIQKPQSDKKSNQSKKD
jgi:small subunit ribosomal protein S5